AGAGVVRRAGGANRVGERPAARDDDEASAGGGELAQRLEQAGEPGIAGQAAADLDHGLGHQRPSSAASSHATAAAGSARAAAGSSVAARSIARSPASPAAARARNAPAPAASATRGASAPS